MNTTHRFGLTVLAVAAFALLAGCAARDVPGVYRIDIQQGNIVTEDMLRRLEPGMDRRKVRFILGTPLVSDTFNRDRWDYLYTFRTGTEDRVQRNIQVYFENDRLARVEGDIEAAWSRQPPAPRNDQVIDVKGPRDDGSLFSALNPFDDEPTVDDGPSLLSSITGGSGRRVIRRVEDVRAEEAAKAAADARATEEAASAASGSAAASTAVDRESAPATVRTVPAAPSGDGEALPPPGSVAETLSQPAPPPPPATESNTVTGSETPAPESGDERSWWQRLTGGDESAADAQPASSSGSTAPPPPAAQPEPARPEPAQPEPAPADNATAATDEPAESGGSLFDRIRNRFELPDTVDGDSLITIKPPEDELSEGR